MNGAARCTPTPLIDQAHRLVHHIVGRGGFSPARQPTLQRTMAPLLFDSTVLIDALRGRPAATLERLLRDVSPDLRLRADLSILVGTALGSTGP